MAKILIFGSSITWGAWDKEGGWAQRLKKLCDQRAFELDFEDYDSVYCLGVCGDKTTELLKRFDIEVEARLDDEDSKRFILIEIGINDSQYLLEEKKHRTLPEEYKANLLKLIEKTKQYHANLIFVGLTPVDNRVDPIPWALSKSYRLEFVKQYEQILKEVCQEQNIPIIAVLDKFLVNDYQKLLEDGVHPNSLGHELIFKEVKDYLIKNKILMEDTK